jgi:hypothetical protein
MAMSSVVCGALHHCVRHHNHLHFTMRLRIIRFEKARVAELVDATDLKSVDLHRSCRFDSGREHQLIP